ncbi:MAG: hypothetical protein WBM02_00225 [bacterium]
MPNDLSRIIPTLKCGDEPLHVSEKPLGYTLLDFWRWSVSDLVSNATRGILAEFIVATALGIELKSVREEWGAYDLITPEGITVEVKSAAYIQSWSQKQYSTILFGIPQTRAWNSETNTQENESRRQAEVYVFALLAHKHKPTIDPLNVDQWKFYVLPTIALDAHRGNQQSITLRSLESLAGTAVPYSKLYETIHKVYMGISK